MCYNLKKNMSKRNILTFEEANQILAPHYPKIAKSILEGFEDFQKTSICISERIGFFQSKTRTKACLIHDLISNRIKLNFLGEDKIEVGEWNGIFGLKISENILIRFKKLNEDYSSSSLPTKQSRAYLKQLPIEGFPDEPTFLFAGYIPDKSWTGVKGLYITCWNGNENVWVNNILKHISSTQTTLSIETKVQEPVKRVKIKQQNQLQAKDGTDD